MSTVPHLLDTNISSYIIKGRHPLVDRRLSNIPTASTFISVVTEAELRYGLARVAPAVRLEKIVGEFLLKVTILPWDSAAARIYADLRATLEPEGQTMSNLDLMIAAHALSCKAVLVTSDHAFTRIKKLKIKDWTRF